MADAPEGLWLADEHWRQMEVQVAALAPEEACGLVGGHGRTAAAVYPVPNLLHSAIRYRMDPRGQLAALLEMEGRGWELLAIYHSHPAGPGSPSETDIAEAYYPEVVQLIWMARPEGWSCRGFFIRAGAAIETPIYRAKNE